MKEKSRIGLRRLVSDFSGEDAAEAVALIAEKSPNRKGLIVGVAGADAGAIGVAQDIGTSAADIVTAGGGVCAREISYFVCDVRSKNL